MRQLWRQIPEKWRKILEGAAIAGGVAVLTFLGRHAADFGDWSPLVAAVVTVGLNTLRNLVPGEEVAQ